MSRIKGLVLATLLLLVGLRAGAAAGPGAPAAPAGFQRDNQHTGDSVAPGVTSVKEVAWKFQSGGPISSSPVVFDGAVYFGSDDDRLYAVDTRSGQELWRFRTGGDIRSTPCVSAELVFCLSEDGNLYALERSTGQERWRFSTGERVTLHDKGIVGIAASPTLEQGLVLFGGRDGRLYALEGCTGQLRWSFATAAAVRSSPATFQGRVYFGSLDGHLYCLDLHEGTLRWKFKTKGNAHAPVGQVQSSPMISDGVVYIGGLDYHLYAVDATTGGQKWSYYAGDQPVYATPAYKSGVICYGTYGFHNPRVYALDTWGRPKWVYQDRDRGLTDAQGRLAINSWDNERSGFTASAVIAGETVYVGCLNNRLYALDLNTGEVRWRFTTGGPITASAAVGDGRVYVASRDGCLYALSGS